DTAIYRAFYRYVYGFFERAEADNVIWVWNPNGGSYPDFKWNHELMYYPGDTFVDIVGMTRYNTGTYYSNFGEKWREFDELYDALYLSYTTRYTQPLMITEFASASMGGDKEQWVERMFAHIGQYPRIKAAVWWDYYDRDAAGNLSRSYLIEETQALMDIFRQNLRQSAPAALIGLSLSQDVPVLP
ncbi:MAG: endoglucanase, partial [Clostridiales bacterium]|nr:endoglucanase [Clostridiales bacterium]